jgi:nucleoside-diphosphate kinase
MSRLEARGLKVVGMKLVQMDREMAGRHYAAHQGKPFFPGLVDFITTSPVVAMVLQGRAVVTSVRESVGATDPATADPGSIRGDFGLDISRNLVHASDSDEAAAREVSLFFHPEELVDWPRDVDRWITGSE